MLHLLGSTTYDSVTPGAMAQYGFDSRFRQNRVHFPSGAIRDALLTEWKKADASQ
jgi:hypothetical protein